MVRFMAILLPLLMEDVYKRQEEYYRDYQKYKVSTVDRERVILACRVMAVSYTHLAGSWGGVRRVLRIRRKWILRFWTNGTIEFIRGIA